jgi:hypothetical protein
MKWGVRKAEYKKMNRQQRKETRKKYYQTPQGRIERAATLGTIFAGPLGGIIAGSIASKKVNDIPKETIDKGKRKMDEYKNTKYETDEQTIMRMQRNGELNPKARYTFDQNGNLFMVTWDD